MFPPIDEPEPEWDHSPQFLTGDGHTTWDESMNIDDKISSVVEPRQLFQTAEPASESAVFQRKEKRRRRKKQLPESSSDTQDEDDDNRENNANVDGLDVSNLVEWEIEVERIKVEESENIDDNTEVILGEASSLYNDDINHEPEEQPVPRPRRSCRKEIDYKHFNTYGSRK